jgi:hypothetical protein
MITAAVIVVALSRRTAVRLSHRVYVEVLLAACSLDSRLPCTFFAGVQ